MQDLRGELPGTVGVEVRRRIDAWVLPVFTSRDGRHLLSRMDVLFIRLTNRYGVAFAGLFPDEAGREAWKREWADGFSAEKLTDRAVRLGLDLCRRRYPSVPPTLGEFLQLACPVPSFEAAFAEAQVQMWHRAATGRDSWSHPAIYWAAEDFGPTELRSVPWSAAKVRWAKLLTARLQQVYLLPVPAFGRDMRERSMRSGSMGRGALDSAKALLASKLGCVAVTAE